MSEHAKENCAFYPGCYYAGDCDLDDWAKQNCGLPPAMKAEARQVFRDRMTSTSPAPAFPDPRTVEAVVAYARNRARALDNIVKMGLPGFSPTISKHNAALWRELADAIARGDPFKETSDV